MCVYICGRSGLWPFRFVAVPVWGRFGLWPFQFVAIPVCGRSGLWPFRFVAVPVCGRFGLWPFRFWPFRFVAVMTRIHWYYHSLDRQSICSTAHWSYGPLVLRPIGPTYSLKVVCPTSDWSYDPLVQSLIGPMPHWYEALKIILTEWSSVDRWMHDPSVPRTIDPTTR